MIRWARVSDAAALATVHITAWQRTYRGDFPEEFLQGLDVQARIGWFETAIGSGKWILVSESDGEVVGFCFVGESAEEGWAEVYSIYVHPDQWGNGHGYELMEVAESELVRRGFDRVLLWVLDSNQRARSFYERQGWVLAKPLKLEEIGGVQVTEVRYERRLSTSP